MCNLSMLDTAATAVIAAVAAVSAAAGTSSIRAVARTTILSLPAANQITFLVQGASEVRQVVGVDANKPKHE